jgi:hypothetical protein
VRSESLEYLGRLDQQVKVRGFRVEPEEVQAVLLAQPGVQALVLIHKDAVGAQLVGYYSGIEQTDAVLGALAERLPAYMVPAQLIHLAQMPLGPSGKVDRKALPAPVWQQREHVEPQTELQQQVAAIWREVLNLPRSACTTTSSPSAATRCWPPRSSRAAARPGRRAAAQGPVRGQRAGRVLRRDRPPAG